MKYALMALALVSPLVFAAVDVSVGGLVELVIYLIVVGLIVGLLIYLVNKAPFIPGEWKQWILYVIYFIVVLIIINFLLGFTGHPIFNIR